MDFRAEVVLAEQRFSDVARNLRGRFPTAERKEEVQARIDVKDSNLSRSIANLGFKGVFAKSANGALTAQFRPNGFTLNNVGTYAGGAELIDVALEAWSELAGAAGDPVVSRVAMRYINQLRLPLRAGDDLDSCMTMSPKIATGLPDQVGEFLSRVVLLDDSRQNSVVILTQRLTPSADGSDPTLVLDIDAAETGEFLAADLPTVLRRLRSLKNDVFFGAVTDRALERYS